MSDKKEDFRVSKVEMILAVAIVIGELIFIGLAWMNSVEV